MSTYDWPNTRVFMPGMAELRVIDNTQRTLESPLSGYVQSLSMPGARWGWGFDFMAQTIAERSAVEGFLLRLSGREHRVRLWDLKRPRPLGSIATSGVTLGAGAAQFATSLVLAGCRGASVLLHGDFEVDSNADGLADGWLRYSLGTTGAGTQTLSAAVVTSGSNGQLVTASALGSTDVDRHGVYQTGVPVTRLAGQTVTLACSMACTAGTRVGLIVDWMTAGGAYISSMGANLAAPAPGAVLQASATGVCPANAALASVYLYQHSGTGGAAVLYVDSARLVLGPSSPSWPGPATLQAGDWLGLTGGQLVRCVADATANDAGAMTVEVRHMLRAAVASGSAVTLERPTALYVRTEAGIALPRQPGGVEPGMSVEFVEVFA